MKIFNVEEFGARSDGRTLNTAAIQSAIDACHGHGGGVVVCGAGEFLTGSIELKSGVELRLESGCRIVGSGRIEDYEAVTADGLFPAHAPEGSTRSLFRAVDASNIGITGPGEIIGSGLDFYDTSSVSGKFFRKPDNERPRMVTMYECRNIRFEGGAYLDSPCWTFWLMKCERVNMHRLRIEGDQRMINNDGIDVDSCKDVTISDCTIRTGDDCLVLRAIDGMFAEPRPCENVVVVNCVLDSWCQGIRLGCPGDGTIRNAVFSNVIIHSRNNGILIEHPKRYLPPGNKGSADMYDLRFSGMIVTSAGSPIRVSVEEGIALTRLSDISFSDIRIRGDSACRIEGSTQTTIRNVSFSSMQIDVRGDEALILRRCEGVTFDRVEVTNSAPATSW